MQHLVKIFYPRDFHFPVPRNKYSIDALVGTHCQFGGLSNNIYLASIDFVGMILVSRTVALSLSLSLSVFSCAKFLAPPRRSFSPISIAISSTVDQKTRLGGKLIYKHSRFESSCFPVRST